MELPHALRLARGDLPGQIPYLAPPPDTAGRRRCRWSSPERLRVGLVWAGGEWRRERSLPSDLLLPLLRLPLDLVGLQRGPAREDLAAARHVGAFCGAVSEDATIAETAALICDLDLVVSVDTMVAHLAGALGRTVWTLLDSDADWRWMRRRTDSPWYPTMRLFRQPEPGVWEPVVEQLVSALSIAARQHRPERDRMLSR